MIGKNEQALEDRMYTVDEVRDLLRLSRSKVYELLQTGELASIKIGAARRIPAKALREFVEEKLAA